MIKKARNNGLALRAIFIVGIREARASALPESPSGDGKH